jgi:hypothetical protein
MTPRDFEDLVALYAVFAPLVKRVLAPAEAAAVAADDLGSRAR